MTGSGTDAAALLQQRRCEQRLRRYTKLQLAEAGDDIVQAL